MIDLEGLGTGKAGGEEQRGRPGQQAGKSVHEVLLSRKRTDPAALDSAPEARQELRGQSGVDAQA